MEKKGSDEYGETSRDERVQHGSDAHLHGTTPGTGRRNSAALNIIENPLKVRLLVHIWRNSVAYQKSYSVALKRKLSKMRMPSPTPTACRSTPSSLAEQPLLRAIRSDSR